MSLVDTIGSVLGGGAIGAVGSAFTRWHQGRLELDKLRIQTQHEQSLAKIELQQLELQAKVDVDKAAYGTLSESFAADTTRYSSGTGDSMIMLVVDAVRGLIRPILTMMLVMCTGYLGLTLSADAYMPDSVKAELLTQIITGLVSCTSMALAWWFGARNIK